MKKNTLKFRKKIFKKTTKPIEYVHIDKPKTAQDYRQMHFNNWSKYHNVYSGSYLPDDPKKLESNGWNKIKSIDKCNKGIYERKSTKQQVLFEGIEKDVQIEHYYWFIGNHKDKINKKQLYNRKKEFCNKGSNESHILPYSRELSKKEFKKLMSKKHYN